MSTERFLKGLSTLNIYTYIYVVRTAPSFVYFSLLFYDKGDLIIPKLKRSIVFAVFFQNLVHMNSKIYNPKCIGEYYSAYSHLYLFFSLLWHPVFFFLFYDRGDFIVPNFEEIWPSGKKKETGPPKGTVYILGQLTLRAGLL